MSGRQARRFGGLQQLAAGGLIAVTLVLHACSTAGNSAAVPLPADARVGKGVVSTAQYLTSIRQEEARRGPGVGVGAGGVGGNEIGSGGFLGAGLSFDISSLFSSRKENIAEVYRYGIRMGDGTMRQVDSTLGVKPGACVAVVDSAQPGFPLLQAADGC